MAGRLTGKRVAVLVDEGFEDLEFWVTVMRLREEGAVVALAGTKPGVAVRGKNALSATPDVDVASLRAEDLDALVIPGGWAPDKLRRSQAVLDLTRAVHARGAIVGMICHAGWVGASAGIIRGSRAVGSLGIKDDLENAGATWVDEPAIRDGNLVWGRVVDDIPQWCAVLVQAIEEG
ncbi:MAG: type 1 glutamine amidotransferase domain-containing protein [Actinomycetota bacterium]